MSAYEQLFRQLDEIGTLSRGKSKHRPRNDPVLYGGPHPFIQTGDVKHSTFYVTSYSQTYSDKGLAQSKLWPTGTLCITIAANIADTAILTFPACFPDSIIGFTAKDGVASTAYVKYCLDTYKAQMRSISQGTTQDNLSQGKLLSLKFRIPDYQTQQKIAAILSAYDDLIANNQLRITLLERMAEDIYREWFVRLRFPGHEPGKTRGTPKGWTVAELGSVSSTLKRGVAPNYVETEDALVINQRCIRDGFVDLAEARGHDTKVPLEKMVRHGDVLINSTGVGTLGRVAVFDLELPNVTCDTHVTICRADPASIAAHYLGHVMKSRQTHFENMAVGSTGQSELSRDAISRTSVLVPPMAMQMKFDGAVSPLHRQKGLLRNQTQMLRVTRDALLPRLISGKLAVDGLDIQFPPGMSAPA